MQLKNGFSISKNGNLAIAGCDTVELATRFGTPLYVMDENILREKCRGFRSAMDEYFNGGRVMFASKAFMNMAMCKIAVSEWLGLDVVSGGELFTALKAGIPSHLIELHGNNKTDAEIRMALENNIYRIIIDGFDEIDAIHRIAAEMGIKGVRVSIRLRPGIEAHTHEAVQTANLDCKFGFGINNGEAIDAARILIADDTFCFCGIHCHIGSQIFEYNPFSILIEHYMNFALELRRQTGFTIKDFNCGGGFGVWYAEGDTPKESKYYIQTIAETLKKLCDKFDFPVPEITIEPGRSIVGEAGTTLYTVGGCKKIKDIRTYVSVDGGMFENPRCALYGARYTALCANKPNEKHGKVVTIAGKCCESGDIITWNTELPESIQAGDTVAVLTTGAYNYSMASNYNRNPIPAVVLVSDGKAELIVKRQTYEDLTSWDIVPEHLK